MSSVSEQIHAYQARKSEQAPARDGAVEADLDLPSSGPTPKEFFKDLMTRWHTNYIIRNLVSRQQRRPE